MDSNFCRVALSNRSLQFQPSDRLPQVQPIDGAKRCASRHRVQLTYSQGFLEETLAPLLDNCAP